MYRLVKILFFLQGCDLQFPWSISLNPFCWYFIPGFYWNNEARHYGSVDGSVRILFLSIGFNLWWRKEVKPRDPIDADDLLD